MTSQDNALLVNIEPKEEPIGITIGRRLDQVLAPLKARGITEAKIVAAAGLKVNYITRLTNGEILDPGIGQLLRLARVLGLSLDELVQDDGGAIREQDIMPQVYLVRHYGLSSPSTIEMVDRLVRQLATAEAKGETTDSNKEETKPRRQQPKAGHVSILRRLFFVDDVIKEMSLGAIELVDKDSELAQLVSAYTEMNIAQRRMLTLFVETIKAASLPLAVCIQKVLLLTYPLALLRIQEVR